MTVGTSKYGKVPIPEAGEFCNKNTLNSVNRHSDAFN